MAITSGKKLPALTDDLLDKAMQKHIKSKGRPTTFTPQLAAIICDRIAEGESLKRICKDADMPARSTVNDWRRHLPQFAVMFARARVEQGSALADDALEILDETGTATNLTVIRSAEVRAKMRLELAKCYDRDTYGDKQRIDSHIQVEHTIGGVIDLVMGQTKPLVCVDAEVSEVPKIEG